MILPSPTHASPSPAPSPVAAPTNTGHSSSETRRDDRTYAAKRGTFKLQIVNLLAVTLPFVGLLAVALFFPHHTLHPVHLSVFVVLYLFTGFGVTVGYHRLFTHKSFETSSFMKWVFGVAGGMAIEGPIRQWVATHRAHHQHSDDHLDPHSPHVHGDTVYSTLAGFIHAHVGWMVSPEPTGLGKYVPDLLKDADVRALTKLFPLWALLSLAIPSVLGGLLTLTWTGALVGLLWGGLARIFFVHHITWSINSVCHLWGTRPFRSHDESRNNAFFGVVGMGEGWHNNHHAFPTSARHGLRWWEIDTSYYLIKLLAALGLVWNVRTPDAQRMAAMASNAAEVPGK